MLSCLSRWAGEILMKANYVTPLTLFACSERTEIGFLGFCQSLNMRDVHMLIWSFSYESLEAVVSLQVPEFDRSIITATREDIPVGAESHPSYPVGVALEYFEAATSMDVPEADSLVLAATGKQAPIVVERDRANPTEMTLQAIEAATAMDVPEADGLILA